MKTVLITGAAGGLGVSLVREYFSRGYRVFGTDIVSRPENESLLTEADGNYLFFRRM